MPTEEEREGDFWERERREGEGGIGIERDRRDEARRRREE